MAHSFYTDLAYVLLAALGGGLLAHLLRAPLILGYIIGGILVGPYTPGLQVSDLETINLLAEIGVVFLMFAIGLEFSLKELRKVRWVALFGGPLGILATLGLGTWAGTWLGWPLEQAVFVGAVVSISSTMVMAKALEGRGELSAPHGRVMIATALVEDLAVVLMLALVPVLGHTTSAGLTEVLWILGRALGLLLPALFLALRVVPPLMERVARTRNVELFLLVAVGIGLGTAAATASLGLSLAIGAFLAGLVISESDYVYETLARILPIRDVFVAIFFVSMGMLIDPGLIGQNLPALGVLVALVVLGRGTLRALITRLFGQPWPVALIVGTGMAHIGEFSFVLAGEGLEAGLLPPALYNAVLAASLSTIVLNALLTRATRAAPAGLGLVLGFGLGRWTRRGRGPRPAPTQAPPKEEAPLRDHVIICGYGRVGCAVGQALAAFHVPYVVIELTPQVIERVRAHGLPYVFGDASSETVCQQAWPQTAALAVLALPDSRHARLAFRTLRRLNPQLPVVARAHWDTDREALFREGVSEVIQPEFEGALEIIRHILVHCGVPVNAMEDYLQGLRRQRYSSVLQQWLEREDPGHRLQHLQEVRILTGSPFAGKSLRQARIRERTGVTVWRVRKARGGALNNPPPDVVLEPDDVVSVIGPPTALIAFVEMNQGTEDLLT